MLKAHSPCQYGERKTFNDKIGIDKRLNFTAIYDF